jgi:hypothetical protein
MFEHNGSKSLREFAEICANLPQNPAQNDKRHRPKEDVKAPDAKKFQIFFTWPRHAGQMQNRHYHRTRH